MKSKKDLLIDELQNSNNELLKKLEQINKDSDFYKSQIERLLVENKQQKSEIRLQNSAAFAPNFSFKVPDSQFLQQSFLNGQNYIKARAANENNLGNEWIPYLLILERAKYFKHYFKFDSENMDLLPLIYWVMYFGSLSGHSGIWKDGKEFKLIQIDKVEFDSSFKIKKIAFYLQDLNQLSAQLNEDNKKYVFTGDKVKDIAYFRFNSECFGLWVIAWFYLLKISEYLEIVNVNMVWLVKKMVSKTIDPNVRVEEIASILNSKIPILFTTQSPNDLAANKYEPLETPNVSLQDIWSGLENYLKFCDYHFCGIRTTDINNGTAREIAGNQVPNSARIDKSESALTYQLKLFLWDIKKNWDITVNYEDNNEDITDTLKGSDDTINKVNEGNINSKLGG